MKVIVCKNYDEMSATAAGELSKQICEKPDSVLGLATGSTPEGMYACLVKDYQDGKLDFSKITTVNLDEYYPITPDNDQSYRYFMNYHLFSKVNINLANTNVPDGTAKDPDAFCADYEKLIDSLGGVDLQILGIGQNGHIGFNEPGDILYPNTHLTDLTDSTIKANARFFDSIDDVPKQALTMGIASIFKAKRIIIMASGKSKHDAIAKMLGETIETKCPATILKLHPNVTLICDEDAYNG
ncbi:MAG: glucosamine-6-phosphate deaminase [Clostridia bacterium]|nr:glucosamine-6-phosphate deaminase [Clostridia bacterium]